MPFIDADVHSKHFPILMMKCTRRGCKSVTLHRVNRYHAPRRQEDEEYQQIENHSDNVDFFTAFRMDGLFGFHSKKVPFRNGAHRAPPVEQAGKERLGQCTDEFNRLTIVPRMMISELTEAAKRLSSDQLRNLISLAKGLK